jgi:hypothetical protein
MNGSNLFLEARKLSNSFSSNYVSSDLEVFNQALKAFGPSTFIEKPFELISSDVYKYKPSMILIFIAKYLKDNYNDILNALARFNKIFEIVYKIDYQNEEQKLIADIASYTFVQQFKNISNLNP